MRTVKEKIERGKEIIIAAAADDDDFVLQLNIVDVHLGMRKNSSIF